MRNRRRVRLTRRTRRIGFCTLDSAFIILHSIPMLIVDAHLDLAYNALRGRDVLRPAAEQVEPNPGK